MVRLNHTSLRLQALVMAILGFAVTPASAAITASVALPVVLDAQDAVTQEKVTVPPMLKTPIDILGARKVSFRSTARLSADFSMGAKGNAVTVAPSDLLVEYALSSGATPFVAYCKGYPSRPLAGLICFADRDANGVFDQVWLGGVSNPRLGVPYPMARLQEKLAIAQAYTAAKGPVGSDLKFGFSVTAAGGLANKRELHLQITNGTEKTYIFQSRITGPSREGPVEASILDGRIRLYGEDSKSVTYSIEKPLGEDVYYLFDGLPEQNIWIYVPR